jgi:hypothetical protein
MAKVRAIFQPVPGAVRHQKHVINLFPKLGVTEVWLSSAFVNSPGVSAIKEVLSSYKSVACCIVGVRNGASTVQGLTALLATGAKIYTVDTGTLSPIFHPKIYAVVSKSEASVIIGSANTTFAGLYNNIEASAHILLNLSDKSDAKFLAGITNSLKFIIKNYPLNCVQLIDIEQANQLLADGIVEDEECQKVLDPVGKSGKGAKSGSVPLMALPPQTLAQKINPSGESDYGCFYNGSSSGSTNDLKQFDPSGNL